MDHDDRPAIETSRPARVAFASLSEDRPGPKWRRVFRDGWPGWSRWFEARNGGRPGLAAAERALRRHMPELAPVWERLVAAAGGDERAAVFLTFWSPPRYLAHCTQVALVDRDGPLLIRNYDLDPASNEGYLLRSAWLGRDVMGMVDGLAGLADGMNGAGLAVSLAFGGRPVVGRGFGIPLIVRYLLEVCANVPDAVEALRALPCHMSYNLTLIDRAGRHATVLLAPDRPAIVTDARFATNHQIGIEWPGHARLSRTSERAACIAEALEHPDADHDRLQRLFHAPPLHSVRYGAGFGTVYTASYRPATGSMQLSWPGVVDWRQSIQEFSEAERHITFTDSAFPREDPPAVPRDITADPARRPAADGLASAH